MIAGPAACKIRARIDNNREEAMNTGTEGTIDTRRLIFPALGGFYQSIAPYSYAIIRFCAGAIVIYHGYMKLFGGFAGPVAQNVLTPLGSPRDSSRVRLR